MEPRRVTKIAGQRPAFKPHPLDTTAYYHKREAVDTTSSSFPRERVSRWQIFSSDSLGNKALDAARLTAIHQITMSFLGAESLLDLSGRIADGLNDIFPYATVEVEFRSDILKDSHKPNSRSFPNLLQNGRSKLFSRIMREPKSVEDVQQRMMGLPLLDERSNLLGIIALSLSPGAAFPEKAMTFVMPLISSASGVLRDKAKIERLSAERELFKAEGKRLKRQVNIDHLTGLRNRRYFEEKINTEFARISRHKQPLSLLFIDIDRFKEINDTYGHQVGDEVLQKLAKTLKVRREDVAARFGGEEFVVLLPDTNHDGAVKSAERIRQAVENKIKVKNQKVTVSIGVSTFADPNSDKLTPSDLAKAAKTLIKSADDNLYIAKNTGRNKVVA